MSSSATNGEANKNADGDVGAPGRTVKTHSGLRPYSNASTSRLPIAAAAFSSCFMVG